MTTMFSGRLPYRLIFVSILCALASCNSGEKERDELAGKSEYSILQKYEYDFRNEPGLGKIVYRTDPDLPMATVIGIKISGEGNRYVAIASHSKTRPLVKMVPDDGIFQIDNNQYSEILKRANPSRHVAEFLRKHVRS